MSTSNQPAAAGADALRALEGQLGTAALAEAIARHNADVDYQARRRALNPDFDGAWSAVRLGGDAPYAAGMRAKALALPVAEPFPGQIGGAA